MQRTLVFSSIIWYDNGTEKSTKKRTPAHVWRLTDALFCLMGTRVCTYSVHVHYKPYCPFLSIENHIKPACNGNLTIILPVYPHIQNFTERRTRVCLCLARLMC